MDDDWGLNADAPTFSLFRKTSPEEEANKDSHVDIIVYNHWTKAQRRLYQKLKTERIWKLIQKESLKTVDDLSMALSSLSMIKEDSQEDNPMVDDLIQKLNTLTVQATSRNPKTN